MEGLLVGNVGEKEGANSTTCLLEQDGLDSHVFSSRNRESGMLISHRGGRTKEARVKDDNPGKSIELKEERTEEQMNESSRSKFVFKISKRRGVDVTEVEGGKKKVEDRNSQLTISCAAKGFVPLI